MNFTEEVVQLLKQRLDIKTDDKNDLLKTYVNGAYEYVVNATGKDKFGENKLNLLKTVIVMLAVEFYYNKENKKDTQMIQGVITQLKYS